MFYSTAFALLSPLCFLFADAQRLSPKTPFQTVDSLPEPVFGRGHGMPDDERHRDSIGSHERSSSRESPAGNFRPSFRDRSSSRENSRDDQSNPRSDGPDSPPRRGYLAEENRSREGPSEPPQGPPQRGNHRGFSFIPFDQRRSQFEPPYQRRGDWQGGQRRDGRGPPDSRFGGEHSPLHGRPNEEYRPRIRGSSRKMKIDEKSEERKSGRESEERSRENENSEEKSKDEMKDEMKDESAEKSENLKPKNLRHSSQDNSGENEEKLEKVPKRNSKENEGFKEKIEATKVRKIVASTEKEEPSFRGNSAEKSFEANKKSEENEEEKSKEKNESKELGEKRKSERLREKEEKRQPPEFPQFPQFLGFPDFSNFGPPFPPGFAQPEKTKKRNRSVKSESRSEEETKEEETNEKESEEVDKTRAKVFRKKNSRNSEKSHLSADEKSKEKLIKVQPKSEKSREIESQDNEAEIPMKNKRKEKKMKKSDEEKRARKLDTTKNPEMPTPSNLPLSVPPRVLQRFANQNFSESPKNGTETSQKLGFSQKTPIRFPRPVNGSGNAEKLRSSLPNEPLFLTPPAQHQN